MENVLLFSPSFYQYGKIIASAIRKDGKYVNHYEYCSSWYFMLASLLKKQKIAKKIKERFFFKLFHCIEKDCKSYDTIIVIRGSEIPIWFYKSLKDKYKNSRFVLYLWDEIDLDKEELDRLCFFDKVLSFSQKDCDQYGFTFRPMFFNDSIVCQSQNKKKYDLLLIASFKQSRYYFLKKVLKSYPQYKIKAILRCSPLTYIKASECLKYWKYFKFRSIPYDRMTSYLLESKACIELPNPGQSAITTRPVEAMWAGIKLVTTSQTIAKYDFFNHNNVLIVNEDNPSISYEWLEKEFVPIPREIIEKYSLTNFVRDLFS